VFICPMDCSPGSMSPGILVEVPQTEESGVELPGSELKANLHLQSPAVTPGPTDVMRTSTIATPIPIALAPLGVRLTGEDFVPHRDDNFLDSAAYKFYLRKTQSRPSAEAVVNQPNSCTRPTVSRRCASTHSSNRSPRFVRHDPQFMSVTFSWVRYKTFLERARDFHRAFLALGSGS
jgi:hypothetical protein